LKRTDDQAMTGGKSCGASRELICLMTTTYWNIISSTISHKSEILTRRGLQYSRRSISNSCISLGSSAMTSIRKYRGTTGRLLQLMLTTVNSSGATLASYYLQQQQNYDWSIVLGPIETATAPSKVQQWCTNIQNLVVCKNAAILIYDD
jgi:hypothetical protein